MHINGIGYLLLFKYAYTLQYLDRAVIVLIVYFGKAYYVKKTIFIGMVLWNTAHCLYKTVAQFLATDSVGCLMIRLVSNTDRPITDPAKYVNPDPA